MTPRRADFGRPIDGFFKKQPAPLRAILDEQRRMVEEIAPDAEVQQLEAVCLGTVAKPERSHGGRLNGFRIAR